MPLIGRPKVAKSLPKALRTETVIELLAVINTDDGSSRRTDWAERDRALVLTSLLAGLRADELLRANVGDIRTTDEGGVIHVRGKDGTDRRIPIEQTLIEVLDTYLDSRAVRVPGGTKRRPTASGSAAWAATAPLFVGSDGERITRGTLQYRVLRAFRKAGLDGQRARGALVHGYATLMPPNWPTPRAGQQYAQPLRHHRSDHDPEQELRARRPGHSIRRSCS